PHELEEHRIVGVETAVQLLVIGVVRDMRYTHEVDSLTGRHRERPDRDLQAGAVGVPPKAHVIRQLAGMQCAVKPLRNDRRDKRKNSCPHVRMLRARRSWWQSLL